MNNEKIKVTIQDGQEICEYEGDLIHLNVLNRDGDDGMALRAETCGSNYIPAIVAEGVMDSALKMIHEISKNRDFEMKLLAIIGMQLMERMKELDESEEEKHKPGMSSTVISGEQAAAVLKGILASLEK